MQFARDQFFAGTGFTPHQDCRVGIGDLVDHRANVLYRFGISEQRTPLRGLYFDTTTQQLIFAPQLDRLERVLNNQTEVVKFEGFGDVIVCTALHRLYGQTFRAMRGDDYDERSVNGILVFALNLVEKLEAADSRKVYVEQ